MMEPVKYKEDVNHGYYHTVLTNGLKVVIKPTDTEQSVLTMIVYGFGSNDETKSGEKGLAHYAEHLAFKGTFGNIKGLFKLSEADITGIARGLGASYNAFTMTDKTAYYFKHQPEFTDTFVKILASSMFDSRLDENHLRSEKGAVLQEFKHRMDDLFSDALTTARQAMYKECVTARSPTIGDMDQILALHEPTLRAFYDRLYHPKNATLFVTGACRDSLQDITESINSSFGSRERPGNQEKTKVEIDDLSSLYKDPCSTCCTFHTISEDEAFLLLSVPVKGMNMDSPNAHSALKAVGFILYGTSESRLNKVLMHTNATDYHVLSVSGYHTMNSDFGEFHLCFQGKAEMAGKAEAIKNQVCCTFMRGLEQIERTNGFEAVDYAIKSERTDLESCTNAWIANYSNTGDLSTYWEQGKTVDDATYRERFDKELTERFEELKAGFDESCWSTVYRTATPKEMVRMKAKNAEKEARFVQSMDSGENLRTTNKEGTSGTFDCIIETHADIFCSKDRAPSLVQQQTWDSVADTHYQLVHVAVSPRQRVAMKQGSDRYVCGLVSQIRNERWPQTSYLAQGVHGFSAPTIAVVSSNETKPAVFEKWVSRYASDMHDDEAAELAAYYEEHKERLQASWRQNIASAHRDPLARTIESVRRHLSDNYYLRNGCKDKFDEMKQEVEGFEPANATATWNEYWGKTAQMTASNAQSKASLPDTADHPAFAFKAPREVPDLATAVAQNRNVKQIEVLCKKDGGYDRSTIYQERIQLHEADMAQVTLSLARRGTMTRSDPDYKTIRPIAETILFHSLGSRLFSLRESSGLFYSASGAFSPQATTQHKGTDYILLQVNADQASDALHRVLNFVDEEFARPVEEAELNAAKRLLCQRLNLATTESNIVSTWVSARKYDEPDFTVAPGVLIDKIQEVTTDDVNKFMLRVSAEPYNFSVLCT